MDKKMIETPFLNHIIKNDWNYVYEPAEDSFLLLDSLELDLDFIFSKKPSTILEVGSGSGIIITALSKICKSSHCLAIDINPFACKMTKSTAEHNKTRVDVVQSNLTSCLKESSIDMIVFNPPYVVTPTDEISTNDELTKSWAGGSQGTEVINRFLDSFSNKMATNSFGYILILKENQCGDIMNKLNKLLFTTDIILKRKVPGEQLYVIKFVKMN